jgi:hypothetical protein
VAVDLRTSTQRADDKGTDHDFPHSYVIADTDGNIAVNLDTTDWAPGTYGLVAQGDWSDLTAVSPRFSNSALAYR